MADTNTQKNMKLSAPIYSVDGKETGNVILPEAIFGLPWNGDLVHQVVTGMQSNARSGSAHTKDRSEVSGGGKKLWRQKGTGRARHGSSLSPIWRTGGVTFGPRNTKYYTKIISKKMRVRALFTALSQKFADGEIIFVDSMNLSAPKTNDAATFLKNLEGVCGGLGKEKNAALIAPVRLSEVVKKSFSNIKRVDVSEVRNLNPVVVLGHKYLVIENPDEAIRVLSGRKK